MGFQPPPIFRILSEFRNQPSNPRPHNNKQSNLCHEVIPDKNWLTIIICPSIQDPLIIGGPLKSNFWSNAITKCVLFCWDIWFVVRYLVHVSWVWSLAFESTDQFSGLFLWNQSSKRGLPKENMPYYNNPRIPLRSSAKYHPRPVSRFTSALKIRRQLRFWSSGINILLRMGSHNHECASYLHLVSGIPKWHRPMSLSRWCSVINELTNLSSRSPFPDLVPTFPTLSFPWLSFLNSSHPYFFNFRRKFWRRPSNTSTSSTHNFCNGSKRRACPTD